MNRRSATTPHLPDPSSEPTLSVDRAAAILGIGRDTAYLCVRSGEIPSIRLRGRIRVPTAALAAMLGIDTQPISMDADLTKP